MLFTEARFLLFFAMVFSAYWALRRNDLRKHLLLAASYIFYSAWDWRFLFLILGSTAINFFAVRIMTSPEPPLSRRFWLWLGLAANLTTLGFFKYFDFFVESASGLLDWLGLSVPARTLHVVLPVGISFYTFQSMSYTVDVYRGRLAPTRSFADFALFVSFFPQLVAGPIVRASTFLPQLERARSFASVEVRRCLALFLLGFFKKACVADQLAVAVDPVFASPERFAPASKWLAACLYHIQIYCDFSGYTDMALATAGLLGYRLTRNFDFPYLARSMREFWRRWHISLSSWFRDYLYVPLGGNRVPRAHMFLNLWIVFLLCGLWHGAAWNFVLWGALHGSLLAVERWGGGRWLDAAPRPLQHLYVSVAVLLAWVVFRSPDLASGLTFLAGMFRFHGWASEAPETLSAAWAALALALAGAHVAAARWRPLARVESLPDWGFALAYGGAVAMVLPWVVTGHNPFIYFQF
ncbi:MAG: MBOAT family protein [Proteobacteria bacterium]|nr:MBOAT family protein [Pseudomonadota bacterium]